MSSSYQTRYRRILCYFVKRYLPQTIIFHDFSMINNRDSSSISLKLLPLESIFHHLIGDCVNSCVLFPISYILDETIKLSQVLLVVQQKLLVLFRPWIIIWRKCTVVKNAQPLNYSDSFRISKSILRFDRKTVFVAIPNKVTQNSLHPMFISYTLGKSHARSLND